MKTLHIQTAKKPAVLAKRLFKLERRGRYEEALEGLSDIWPDHELPPQVGALEARDGAEILLRCGSLIGFHGHNAQLPGAQERSRDLLMAARSEFLNFPDIEKIAECENYLALSYWRTGEQNEAQIWIDEAFSRDLPVSNPVTLFSTIIQCLIHIPARRFNEILARLNLLESSFLDHGDDCLRGDFYNHCALAQRNLDNRTEALRNFELAKFYHQRSRHKIYLGTDENNLAQLYKETGKFHKAHESIDNATRIFRQLKDRTREGYSLDTKALVYFAEAKYSESLRTVEKALTILRKSENAAYLIDTLMTKSKTLIFLDNFPDAALTLVDAMNIAKVQTGDASAERLTDEFRSTLDAKNASPKKGLEEGDLELILPQSIAHFSDYRGIWMNNTRLEDIGLAKGSLAIVVKDKIDRGDLVAVAELESEHVTCGFYDADFGIVCLESTSGEPQLFDEKDIRVLGKIVGVCDTGKGPDGKMVVESLKL